MTIRRAGVEDIESGVRILQQCYPGRVALHVEDWARWLIKHPQRLVLIGQRSVGCAQFSWNYGSEPVARLVVLAAIPRVPPILEPLRMVRMMVAWAKAKGAKGHFRLDADTGVDFGAFAARLGGKELTTKYWAIPLE